MGELSKVEMLFQTFDETATILQNDQSIPYLDALAETGDNLFEKKILQEVDELTKKRLNKHYDSITLDSFTKEEIRKGLQLTILKGMKQGVQSHHMMTPDAVALFTSYLVNKLVQEKEEVTILDPALGTGNLLTAILNHAQRNVRANGIEVDETLLRLAFVNANLQQHSIELFNQDALQPLYVDPVDLVVCDLPVGYYPNDEGAKNYRLKANEGHSFAHHLFIEQALNYTKDGGYVVALIPNFLFESNQATQLNEFLKEKSEIIGLLQLPLSMFKNEKQAKSIFVLQKKGEGVEAPKQALLVNLPKFSNKQAMEDIMQQIDRWFKFERYDIRK